MVIGPKRRYIADDEVGYLKPRRRGGYRRLFADIRRNDEVSSIQPKRRQTEEEVVLLSRRSEDCCVTGNSRHEEGVIMVIRLL